MGNLIRGLLVIGAALAATKCALAGTAASWLGASDGYWSDGNRWSTGPNYPRNGFPTAGDTYDVFISAASSPYKVTFNFPPTTLDSLKLDSPDATLSLFSNVPGAIGNSSITAVNGIAIDNGTLSLDGADIRSSVISGSGGQIRLNIGRLDGVTLRHDALIADNTPNGKEPGVVIRNGLTLDGATITLQRSTDNSHYTAMQFFGTGAQTLAGTGTIRAVGELEPWIAITGGLKIAQGVTIEGTPQLTYDATVNNYGTLRALAAGRPLWLRPITGDKFFNYGTMEASAGATLLIENDFINKGTIRADGGDVDINLLHAYFGTNLGTLDTGTGTISITGTIQNDGHLISSNSAAGRLILDTTISNGQIGSAPGASVEIPRASRFNNVTVSGEVQVKPADAQSPAVLNFLGLSLNNARIHLGGIAGSANPAASLRAVPGEYKTFISGSGEIIFEDSDSNEFDALGANIDSGVTVRTGSGGGTVRSLVTRGTISAQTPGSSIALIDSENYGTIEARNGGRLLASNLKNHSNLSVLGGGEMVLDGQQEHLSGAMATTAGGVIRLDSNAGQPATATAAAVANLKVIARGDDARIVLGADQDLRTASLANDTPGNPSLDLASPAATPRLLRIYPATSLDFSAAFLGTFMAIHNNLAGKGGGIFDSNLLPGGRVAFAEQTDAHNDRYILIRPTRIGDLNLDGAVTIADFIDLSANFGRTNAFWSDGDVNYDSAVTIADFIELAGNFNTTYSGEVFPISPSEATLLSDFAFANVPEPAYGLLLLSATAVAAIRHRK